jgi:hypothetical protein
VILAIDFDGTIHNPKDRDPGYKMGKPIPGAVEALQQLHNEGHRIVVHSVWASSGIGPMAGWLRYFNVPYDDITSQKPLADFYIDDRAIRFVDWPGTLEALRSSPQK